MRGTEPKVKYNIAQAKESQREKRMMMRSEERRSIVYQYCLIGVYTTYRMVETGKCREALELTDDLHQTGLSTSFFAVESTPPARSRRNID
jgi:hypothetical protein